MTTSSINDNNINLSQYISSVLIIFIQIGFGMLQIGGVQLRRSRKMLIKSIFDLSICGLGWWFIGYGIAYGNDSNQFVGSSMYSILQSNNNLWFLSWSLCSLSLSVVSNCIAERIRFGAYFTNAIIYVFLIFPFIVHWAWGNGWASPYRSKIYEELLGGCGVLDYSGSGVLHFTGGITALTISKLIGPRKGRFIYPGLQFHEYSTIFQSIGTIIVWVGWYGIIGGTAQINEATNDVLSRSITSTTIAACSGCLTSLILGYIYNGFVSPSLSNCGLLSGLVAISASCSTCTLYGALIIGFIAGCLYYISSILLVYLEIDDVTDAIPIHMINGAWGLIAAGLFTTKEYYEDSYFSLYTDGTSRVNHCAGLFYGGSGYQLACNICFILTIISWCGSLSLIFHFIVDFILGMECFEERRKLRNSIDINNYDQEDFENQGL